MSIQYKIFSYRYINYCKRNNSNCRATVELIYGKTQTCLFYWGTEWKLTWYYLLPGFWAYQTVFKWSLSTFGHLILKPLLINIKSCFVNSMCSLHQTGCTSQTCLLFKFCCIMADDKIYSSFQLYRFLEASY